MSSGGAPSTPAFQELTAQNRGPVVIVASYIFFVITAIVVFTRLITRFKLIRRFGPDDYLILASTLVLLAQTIAITFAVEAGLGRHRTTLDNPTFDRYAKAYYIARILSILALSLAKSSASCLIISIKPPKALRLACHATLALINIWAFAALLATIFECTPPRVWQFQGQCVNQWALYLSNVIWNIVTDLILVLLPFFLMRKVQVSTEKRWLVVGLFGCRIIVPAFAIAGAVATAEYWTASPPDPTWNAIQGTLWLQAVINLSIITACIPCIKRFLADLSTGMMTVNIPEPLELTMKNLSVSDPTPDTTRGTGTFKSKLFSSSRSRSNNKSTNSTMTTSEKQRRPQLVPPHSTRTTTIEKSESMDNLTDGVIMHTVDYEVNYEQGRTSRAGRWENESDKIESVPSQHTSTPQSSRGLDER